MERERERGVILGKMKLARSPMEVVVVAQIALGLRLFVMSSLVNDAVLGVSPPLFVYNTFLNRDLTLLSFESRRGRMKGLWSLNMYVDQPTKE